MRAASLPPRLARGALRPRQIAVAGLHGHGLLALEVAHLDRAAPDLRQRAVALVLGEPDRAADRRRAVLARRAELALAVAPELAEHRLRPLLLVHRRRPRALQRRALRRRRALEHDVGDQRRRLLRLLLRDG